MCQKLWKKMFLMLQCHYSKVMTSTARKLSIMFAVLLQQIWLPHLKAVQSKNNLGLLYGSDVRVREDRFWESYFEWGFVVLTNTKNILDKLSSPRWSHCLLVQKLMWIVSLGSHMSESSKPISIAELRRERPITTSQIGVFTYQSFMNKTLCARFKEK